MPSKPTARRTGRTRPLLHNERQMTLGFFAAPSPPVSKPPPFFKPPVKKKSFREKIRWGRLGFIVFGLGALIFGGFVPPWGPPGARPVPSPEKLARENPPTTQMLLRRARQAEARGKRFQPRWTWVPLSRLGLPLQNAVIAAEDSTFYQHRGVEWGLTRAAFLESWKTGRRDRGASTLTQQVARNLYLSPEKTYLRKAREIVLAQRLEKALSKDRLLEIYLNIAEWGDGIFGAEAAARAYFGKSAADLTWDEAIAMTSVLPSPRRHRPTDTGRWVSSRKAWVLQRLVTTRRYTPPASVDPPLVMTDPQEDERDD